MVSAAMAEQGVGIAASIADLFCSRTDTFAYQWFSAARQVGGYARACSHRPPWVRGRCEHRSEGRGCGACEQFDPLAVSERAIGLHLSGAFTMGAYQIGADGASCMWGCIDHDDRGDTDPEELRWQAWRVRETLERWGLAPATENSGGTGFRMHLWTFFGAPVPALKVRVVLDAVLRECGLWGAPHIEVFPKQTRAIGGYGNLVRVPFGVHQKTRRRSQFVDGDWRPIASMAEAVASVRRVDPLVLDYIADVRELELVEQPAGQARPAKNFDHPAEGMARVLEGCWYFQELERRQRSRQERVEYEDWFNLVLMFSRFGEAGVEYILRLSALDDRFDHEYTVKTINYVRERGYHAPSCRRLRGGTGSIGCSRGPLECGVG